MQKWSYIFVKLWLQLFFINRNWSLNLFRSMSPNNFFLRWERGSLNNLIQNLSLNVFLGWNLYSLLFVTINRNKSLVKLKVIKNDSTNFWKISGSVPRTSHRTEPRSMTRSVFLPLYSLMFTERTDNFAHKFCKKFEGLNSKLTLFMEK